MIWRILRMPFCFIRFLSAIPMKQLQWTHQAFGVQRASHPHAACAMNDLNDLNVQFTVQLTGNSKVSMNKMNLQCRVYNENSRLFELWIVSNAALLDIWLAEILMAPWPASSRIPWLVPTGRWPPAELRSCHSQMVQQPANAHRDLQNDETCSRNM